MYAFLFLLFGACGEEELPLQYYTSCGDPVCEGYAGPTEGLAICSTEEEAATCSEEGSECDLENACNQRLICASSNPALECPVSEAKHKRDIVYINEKRSQEIAESVQKMKIAEWNYNKDEQNRKARLGFLIDDHAQLPAVLANGKQVDLYGYTSMTVVALQQQAKHIERLEAKIAELEQKLEQK